MLTSTDDVEERLLSAAPRPGGAPGGGGLRYLSSTDEVEERLSAASAPGAGGAPGGGGLRYLTVESVELRRPCSLSLVSADDRRRTLAGAAGFGRGRGGGGPEAADGDADEAEG